MNHPVIFEFPLSTLTQEPASIMTAFIGIRMSQQDTKYAVYGVNADGTSELLAEFAHELHSWAFASRLAELYHVAVEDGNFYLTAIEAAIHNSNQPGMAS